MKTSIFLIILLLILGLVLTGCLLSNVGQVPTTEQSGITYLTKGLPSGLLVGWWRFNGDADDSSGNNNNGTVEGGATYVLSPMGQALSFDGVDDYVNCGSGASLKPSENITIEMWINPSSTQNQYADILGGHQNNQGYVVQQDSNDLNNYYFAYNNDGTAAGWQGMWIKTLLIPDEWQHFVVQKEGNTIRHFLNGTLSASGTVSGDIYYSPTEPFYIGIGWNLSSHRYFKGYIDEVRIWALMEIVINGCHTGVADTWFEGELISVQIQALYDSAKNHGQFVRDVANFTNELMKDGIITGEEKGKIQSCAAQANQLPKEEGLVLWLDAGKGIEAASGVSMWEDQSVSCNDAAQANTSYQPIYVTNELNGYPVVRFPGGEKYLHHSPILTDSYTAFYVLKLSRESSINKLYYYHAGNVNAGDLGFFAECMNKEEGWGSVGNVGNSVTVRTSELYPTPLDWRIQIHQPEALYKDGVEVVYARDDNVYAGDLTDIGSRSDNKDLFFVGDIAEILVYDRILTVSERKKVEAYLNAKYNIY